MNLLRTGKFYFSLLFVVFVLAVFFRFWQLGTIPSSMSDDETRLVYSAYSLWQTGKDLNGKTLPFAFVIGGYAFNPVPIYLTAPFVGILGLSMLAARAPFALAGTLVVVFVWAIAWIITKNRWIALFSAAVLTVNAWALQLSRFAYEGGIALLLYTAGTLLFLLVTKRKKWFLIASMCCFILGFYSYSGFKMTFLPILCILTWYKWRELTRFHFLTIAAGVVLAFGSLFLIGKAQGALNYGGSLTFVSDWTAVAKEVELERRASSAPEGLKRLYHNKATYIWKGFIERYQYALSPQFLFTGQEASGIFALWGRGEFYYQEAALFVLGILYLFLKRRREVFLMLFLSAAAPLPSGLGPEPTTYAIRSSFLLPWMAVGTGAGFISVGYFLRNRFVRICAFLLIGILYLYSIGGYVTQYYFEWMRYGARYYSRADHDLADFLRKEERKGKKIVVASVQPMTFLQYAFYTKLPPARVQHTYLKSTIVSGTVTFSDKCPDFHTSTPESVAGHGAILVLPPQCFDSQRESLPDERVTTLSSFGSGEWYIFQT
ncbi:glycosyltransferase family 39 protein [Patescibacteria group bacterium]|nr:glycosyltransferase family 39 protein [Patescibacteria group bacterium]